MKKRVFLILGLLTSAVFIYLSIQDVEFDGIFSHFDEANYVYLGPIIILNVLLLPLRAIRLHFTIRHIKQIDIKELIPITAVGYLAITVFPLRLGELMIPYLIGRNYKVSMTSITAGVIVERAIDTIILGILLVIIVLSFTLPGWLKESGFGMLWILLAFIPLGFILFFFRSFWLDLARKSLTILPDSLEQMIAGRFEKAIEGFYVIKNWRIVSLIVFLSLLIFLTLYGVIESLFGYFNLDLPGHAALLVLILNVIGVTLPTSPGMIGNIQYATIVALTIVSVDKTQAFVFANFYYVISVGITILLGMFFLTQIKLEMSEIKEKLFSS